MKYLITVLLALVFSATVQAEGFMCRDYTDHSIKATNPSDSVARVKSMVTNIRVNPNGYSISANGVFKKNLTFTNPRFGQLNKFASNDDGMIFKKAGTDGKPYFMVVTTVGPERADEEPNENPINRMVTLGNCTER